MKKILLFIVFLSLLAVLAGLFFEIRFVSGEGMEPTLQNKQKVIVKKFLIAASGLKRGDIVLYYPKDTEASHIGRVVGLPKESIRIESGNLYLDDNVRQYQVIEEYLPQGTKTTAYQENKWFKIGEFEYFITDDDREDHPINIENSITHKNNIKGKIITKI